VFCDIRRRMKTYAENVMYHNRPKFDASKPSSGEPSLATETYRRAVENDVVEMWYYLRSQLTQLKHQLEAVDSQNMTKNAQKKMNDILETGDDYKRQVRYSFLLCEQINWILVIN